MPGGGFSLDGQRWISCRPRFFLAVHVLSELFRGLFLHKLSAAYRAGELQFFGKLARLFDPRAFAAYLAPLWNTNWVVYCKRPFGGPKEVLRYLARYTHRVAISNRRLIACDDKGVTFKWKDYRREGRERYKVMTLATHEFIRRFLICRSSAACRMPRADSGKPVGELRCWAVAPALARSGVICEACSLICSTACMYSPEPVTAGPREIGRAAFSALRSYDDECIARCSARLARCSYSSAILSIASFEGTSLRAAILRASSARCRQCSGSSKTGAGVWAFIRLVAGSGQFYRSSLRSTPGLGRAPEGLRKPGAREAERR